MGDHDPYSDSELICYPAVPGAPESKRPRSQAREVLCWGDRPSRTHSVRRRLGEPGKQNERSAGRAGLSAAVPRTEGGRAIPPGDGLDVEQAELSGSWPCRWRRPRSRAKMTLPSRRQGGWRKPGWRTTVTLLLAMWAGSTS